MSETLKKATALLVFNILRHGSVNLDARQISYRMPFSLCRDILISCNKLHATRKITSSAVDFADILNVVEIHRTFWRFNIVRHGSVHLDAR